MTAHVQDFEASEPQRPDGRPPSIGRYLVLNLVGKGAMGEVYAAYDPELDRKVAIKLLRGKPGNDAEAAEGRARMMREAQAIAKLSHPNVVVVYDVGAFADKVFVAMEFVEGHTAWYWMHAQKRHWFEVLKVFADAGRGLAAAHEKGLVHRDFKPDNVMVGADGQVRVMDFGLARSIAPGAADRANTKTTAPLEVPTPVVAADISSNQSDGDAVDYEDMLSTRAIRPAALPTSLTSSSLSSGPEITINLTQEGAILGTPAYMSPEQFKGQETDARTDQFSFCVALYEALYGERPYPGDTPHAVETSILSGEMRPAPARSEVPAWLRRVLARGLRADTADRWPSMKALLAELDNSQLTAGHQRFVDGAASRLADIWPPPVDGQPVEAPGRAQMRRAFLDSGKRYAATTFERVSETLDRYANAWAQMYVEICEATHVRGEQSAEVLDLRMACLMELLQGLRALCSIFRDANGDVVENAINAVNALGNVERCADLQFLRAVVRPPEDPATRAEVDRLRARLADARVLGQVGRLTEGLAAVAPIEGEARALGYVPLVAETLLEQAKMYAEQRNGAVATKALEETFWAAELCRHDEVAIEAATLLVFMTGESQRRFDVSELWARHAEAILLRLGGHDIMWGWLFNNRGAVREREGRLTDALADARRAVTAKEQALGGDNPDVALSVSNIGVCLAQLDLADEALPHQERAFDILKRSLGSEHPRTALVASNYAEALNRLGRFAEAAAAASTAASVFEREMGPQAGVLAYPLTALGIAHLGERRFAEALLVLERVAAIRDGKENHPVALADTHFALARALWETGQDLPRARELAARAIDEYRQSPTAPAVDRDLAAVRAWLGAAQGGG